MASQRSCLVVVGCLALSVLLLPRSLQAAVVGGTLTSISPTQRQIVVRISSRGVEWRFQLSRVATVTLDGKRATLSQLKPGLRVSLYTISSRTVRKLVARSVPSAQPTEIPKPAHEPKSSPEKPASEPEQTLEPARRTHATSASSDAVWPQFRGPKRDNISSERGLLSHWPSSGPRMLWSVRGLGEGYSTVSVAHGRVYTMGNVGDWEMIHALDLETGQLVWSVPHASASRLSRGNGPRSTPTIDGDRLYALGGSGDLTCANALKGQIVWQKNILREFQARQITWGISESVLIDGERLICTPGGRGATLVALDKNTGRAIWRSRVPGDPQASYASVIVAESGGVRQYVTFTNQSLVGIRAEDGTFLWSDHSSANTTANCSTPIFYRGFIFSSSGYGAGGALLQFQGSRGRVAARRVYTTKDMKNHHGGMVIVDGFLYGSNDPGILTCLELRTGRAAWQNRSVGKGSIVYADGHLYLRSERGPVALVEATPSGYREKGRFDQPQRSNANAWSHPVVADGKLFLRDQDILLCYDVRASKR